MVINNLESFGAEVCNLDCRDPLLSDTLTELKRLHSEQHVLVFRNQSLTPAQLVQLASQFGQPSASGHAVLSYNVPEHPEILIISNVVENDQPKGISDAGLFWHADGSFKKNPYNGIFLQAVTIPQGGGETWFADQQAAYDDLPTEVKTVLENLKAEHIYWLRYQELQRNNRFRPNLTQQQIDANPPMLHSVVQTHPVNGRKTLFVNPHYVSRVHGLRDRESRELLEFLLYHSTAPRYLYKHKWKPNDIVYWDNRAVIHIATGTPPDLPRTLHRVCLAGTSDLT